MWIALIKKVLKDLLSPNPWNKIDPDNKFRDRLKVILGRWEFARLSGILHMYDAFEKDFFKKDFLLKLPEENKLDAFIIFINNFANFLFQNKCLDDAEIVSLISIKIREGENPVHGTLAPILYLKGKYQEAVKEAETALNVSEKLELQSDALPNEYKKELGVDDKTSFEEYRQLLYELIRKCKESI